MDLHLASSRHIELGIVADVFDRNDVHVHVRAGALTKDRLRLCVAKDLPLASSAHDRPVRSDCAMTDEIGLLGVALPIGGVKEDATGRFASGHQGLATAGLQQRGPGRHS